MISNAGNQNISESWQLIKNEADIRIKMRQKERSSLPIHHMIKAIKQVAGDLNSKNEEKLELIQKVKILSQEKLDYYRSSRFGFIKKCFSCLRNWFSLGLLKSSGQLGFELCDKILRNQSSLQVIDELKALASLAKSGKDDRQGLELKPDARKNIVIHLDINGTLILMDTATNKDVKECINEALAKRIISYWPDYSEPCSFFDYVYNHLVPGAVSDKSRKPQRDKLVTTFEDFVKEHNLLFFSEMKKVIQIAEQKIEALSKEQKSIVPSFYHMVARLKKEDVNFSVQLRTFGKDLDKTKKEIEANIDLKFAQHIDLLNSNLYEKDRNNCLVFKEGEISKLADSFLKNSTVQDNYGRWSSGGETGFYGKPFPVIDASKDTSIFFDDNAESPREGKQVKVIVGPKDISGNDLDIETLKTQGLIVKADPVEALLDPYYFVNKVFKVLNSKP